MKYWSINNIYIEDGGILLYNESDKKNIKRLKMRGNLNEKKKVDLIAYLIELMFDLIIAPRYNI